MATGQRDVKDRAGQGGGKGGMGEAPQESTRLGIDPRQGEPAPRKGACVHVHVPGTGEGEKSFIMTDKVPARVGLWPL